MIMTSNNNIVERIKTLGKKVLPEGSHLLLYGSRARGDNRPDSDWDLLVLLNRQQNINADFASISYPLMELGFDLGQYFSVHTYSQKEWNNMSFLPFYKNVERDKIQLV
jgi:predicted nucleotidyltransferase